MPRFFAQRRFRFSLRALLVLVALVALLFGWVHTARYQRQLAAQVEHSNPSATILYDYEVGPDGRLQAQRPLGPAWLRDRLGVDYFCDVFGVDMMYATDADLESVARLAHLRRLYLERSVDVTDAGLERLLPLEHLTFLVLDDADQVTDAGLRTIGRLKTLRVLQLDHSRRMTRAGLEQLKRDLPDCRITVLDDAGEPELAAVD